MYMKWSKSEPEPGGHSTAVQNLVCRTWWSRSKVNARSINDNDDIPKKKSNEESWKEVKLLSYSRLIVPDVGVIICLKFCPNRQQSWQLERVPSLCEVWVFHDKIKIREPLTGEGGKKKEKRIRKRGSWCCLFKEEKKIAIKTNAFDAGCLSDSCVYARALAARGVESQVFSCWRIPRSYRRSASYPGCQGW